MIGNYGDLLFYVYFFHRKFILINYSTIALKYEESKANAFVQVFLIFWLGAYIISLNNKMLQVSTSFFQCVCFLGYSLFPLNLITVFFLIGPAMHVAVRIALVLIMSLWSVKASYNYIFTKSTEDNRILVTYPICLFYSFMGWFVITASA